jgi:hypothetical protein
MSRPVVLGCLLLAACEPVLLVADERSGQSTDMRPSAAMGGGNDAEPASDRDAEVAGSPSGISTGSAEPPAPRDTSAAAPEVSLTVKAIDCGSCFDLVAAGKGGMPPYKYEWNDGSRSDRRRVCVGESDQEVWVVVEDAASERSNAYFAQLQTEDGEACGNGEQPRMCLLNPSFEGTPAINTGAVFDAIPWSDCFDPSSDTVVNTPDIANRDLDPMTGIAPEPSEGETYLALRTGQQASQKLCEELGVGDRTSLQLDALRLNVGSPDMYLQIWGGSSATCSQRQLLWVSPSLSTEWTTYCVTIEPSEYMDLITLRSETPMPMFVQNYLAVDNLLPVAGCP